ncbi:DUF1905 domain-containing protein [Gemmatimonas sp.]
MAAVVFTAQLWRYPGKGGWHFVTVPPDLAPPPQFGWGRTPVRAEVNGRAWDTSTWHERTGRTLLPLPKHIRQALAEGDEVTVTLSFTL